MSDEGVPGRLRDELDTFERELLLSAVDDRPTEGTQAAALGAVLEKREQERVQQGRRTYALMAGAVALAAVTMLVVRANNRPPAHVKPEPATSPRLAPAPTPSDSSPHVSPLAPCSPAVVGSGHDPLIDDFEDGDTRTSVLDKRSGFWSVFNDETAVQHPAVGEIFKPERIPGGRGESKFALHTRGGRFTKWGASLAAELSPRRCYDASNYAGIAFWARGKARVRVGTKMTQTVGEEFGGSCQHDCFDGHGAIRDLTREWQHYEVRWEEMAQTGFGQVVEFDPHSLFMIEISTPAGQAPYDFWLDDVTWILK
jgi:hypothetical protein